MTKLRLLVEDRGAIARVTLKDADQVLGVVAMPFSTYDRAVRDFVGGSRQLTLETLSAKLQEIVWRDAQSGAEGNAELAKKRLEELGVTLPVIARWAEELAKEIAAQIVNRLPEVKTA